MANSAVCSFPVVLNLPINDSKKRFDNLFRKPQTQKSAIEEMDQHTAMPVWVLKMHRLPGW